jgi:hypothetical protein
VPFGDPHDIAYRDERRHIGLPGLVPSICGIGGTVGRRCRGGLGQSAAARRLQRFPSLDRYPAGYWYAVRQFQNKNKGSIP